MEPRFLIIVTWVSIFSGVAMIALGLYVLHYFAPDCLISEYSSWLAANICMTASAPPTDPGPPPDRLSVDTLPRYTTEASL